MRFRARGGPQYRQSRHKENARPTPAHRWTRRQKSFRYVKNSRVIGQTAQPRLQQAVSNSAKSVKFVRAHGKPITPAMGCRTNLRQMLRPARHGRAKHLPCRLRPVKKRMRDICILRNKHPHRCVAAIGKLKNPAAQNSAQCAVEPRQMPVFTEQSSILRSMVSDFPRRLAIFQNTPRHPRHVDTIHRHIQTVSDKFADNVFQRRFGNVHLVKRLNRKQPCCRTSIAVVLILSLTPNLPLNLPFVAQAQKR